MEYRKHGQFGGCRRQSSSDGYVFSADGWQYTILEKFGSGANTVTYLTECSYGEFLEFHLDFSLVLCYNI